MLWTQSKFRDSLQRLCGVNLLLVWTFWCSQRSWSRKIRRNKIRGRRILRAGLKSSKKNWRGRISFKRLISRRFLYERKCKRIRKFQIESLKWHKINDLEYWKKKRLNSSWSWIKSLGCRRIPKWISRRRKWENKWRRWRIKTLDLTDC